MIIPPYHGATSRVGEPAIESFFRHVSDAISIPIMIQDAPVAGTPLSPAFLAKLAREVENVSYYKIEVAQAAAKLRTLRCLLLINYENRQTGHSAAKILMKEGGIIRSAALRHPLSLRTPRPRPAH